jgi:hypothetical protein
MENTIDKKDGAEHYWYSVKNILPTWQKSGFVHRGANIYMTARQAETILMLSDFLETPKW